VTALLEVHGLMKRFGDVRAVDGISFRVGAGETVALVGESGCGKTTTGRCVLRLIEPDAGEVVFAGRDVRRLRGRDLLSYRRDVQVIFQDPFTALNPRLRVGAAIGEPLRVHRIVARRDVPCRVGELLGMVQLGDEVAKRWPHELSGGQRQRIVIARALAMRPRLIVADEPTAALDVSVQAQVLNLLRELQERLGIAYLLISHNLAVVLHMAHFMNVMYLGRIVESGPAENLFATPRHPYTQALLSAVPVPDPTRQRRRIVLLGEVPDPAQVPAGCRFHPRCPLREERCTREEPPSRVVGEGQQMACWVEQPSAGGG
jgi:oligopeptide/dipeptide ABC transporter ATP-binding protein